MWLLTPEGFFSAVEDPRDEDLIVVRTRVIADAEALALWASEQTGKRHHVVQLPGRDYPARVFLDRESWARYVVRAAANINYGNFKSEVERRQGLDRELVYGRVWSVLLDLEKFNEPSEADLILELEREEYESAQRAYRSGKGKGKKRKGKAA